MNQIEEKYRKLQEIKRRKRIFTYASFVLYGLSIWAILAWYDWKLILVLIAFVGANNLMVEANKL